MRIAITGASGFIATNLIAHLHNAGHQLLLFSRDAKALAAAYPSHACSDYDDFELKVADCATVLHTAVLNNDTNASLDAFRSVNVDLAMALASAAQNAGVPLFINFATFQAMQPPFGSWYAQSKYEGERALNALTAMRIVHLRLPAVYAGTFRGTLAALNHLPRILRQPAFYVLAALRPTLRCSTLLERLDALLAASPASLDQDILVSDGQNQNGCYRFLKRSMDLSFAMCVIVFLWWAMLAAWLAVRLSSPGPVIFAQPRIGRFGETFICYKFRTMRLGVKQAATHEMGQDAITNVGRFLRRTKIDELPQILNIFRNEMSLIGPRPCLESQTALIEARRARGVLAVKPGISGLAQVQGVDMSDPERLAALDAQYLARQSILLDLKITLATVRPNALKDRTQQ